MGRFNHQLTKTHFKGWGHRVIQSQNQPIGEAMMDLFLSDTWLPRCQIIDILCEQKVGRCLIQGSWRYHPHHRRLYLLLSLLLLAFACPLQWTLSVVVCQYDSNYALFFSLSTWLSSSNLSSNYDPTDSYARSASLFWCFVLSTFQG